MRKIESDMLQAIKQRRYFKRDNTEVTNSGDCTYVDLHGNRIAIIDFKERTLTLSSCGWHTTTTKSRLNAIIHEFSTGNIYQKNFDWYFSSLILSMNVSFTDGMVIPFDTHWSQR